MKKLRLLVTEKCNRGCKGCCNNAWDLKALPVCKNYTGYEEIMLTGGEPMIDWGKTARIAAEIREKTNCPIYMYTAGNGTAYAIYITLFYLDGICLTLHTQDDLIHLRELNDLLKIQPVPEHFKHISFRLNIFDGIEFNENDTKGWQVRANMKWIKDCPLPTNEVFMRYE